MALGDQSKALRIMSKARGWDPTVIPARGGKPEVDISNWDKAPGRPGTDDHCLGQLPEGIHDSYPQAEQPHYEEKVTWNTPDVSRETADYSTRNAKDK